MAIEHDVMLWIEEDVPVRMFLRRPALACQRYSHPPPGVDLVYFRAVISGTVWVAVSGNRRGRGEPGV